MQITDVAKALASVGKICAAGNRVVFEPDGGYIENVASGSRTQLRKEGAAYKLDMWVTARHAEDGIYALASTNGGKEGTPGRPPFRRQEAVP